MSTNDAHTHPNDRKAGPSMAWRNQRGERVQTAQSRERDRRVAIVRDVLADKPNATPVDIVLGFRAAGIEFTLKTAERYLAMAREAME